MLSDKVIELAQGQNFAVVSTILASGHPQTHMMYVDTDGEHVIVNTEIDRTKFKNLERNPLVTVLIMDRDDPWHWAEVRGHVAETVRGQEARDHIDTMARKYLGVDDYPNPIRSERVMVKVAPDRVVTFPPG